MGAIRNAPSALPAPFHVQFGLCVSIVKCQVPVECMVDCVADVARQMKPGRQDVSAAARGFDGHDALHRMICPQICLAVACECQDLRPMAASKSPERWILAAGIWSAARWHAEQINEVAPGGGLRHNQRPLR